MIDPDLESHPVWVKYPPVPIYEAKWFVWRYLIDSTEIINSDKVKNCRTQAEAEDVVKYFRAETELSEEFGDDPRGNYYAYWYSDKDHAMSVDHELFIFDYCESCSGKLINVRMEYFKFDIKSMIDKDEEDYFSYPEYGIAEFDGDDGDNVFKLRRAIKKRIGWIDK
jgi:hypothetical protein